MVDQPQAKWVVPNPQICRSFGLMNIIFGAILLLFAVGYAVMLAVAPTFQKQIMASVEQEQAEQKAARQAKLAELKTKASSAKTEEEKVAIKDEQAALEKEVEPDLSSMNEIMGWNIFSDSRLAAYSISEVTASIILNLLLIIAGAGLLATAEWARRLSVWVAWGKILRWLVMIVATMVVILPISMEKTQKALAKVDEQIRAQNAGRPTPIRLIEFARMGAIAGAVSVIFSAVLSSIYPALSIWFLTRPQARAACLKALPSSKEQPGVAVGEAW